MNITETSQEKISLLREFLKANDIAFKDSEKETVAININKQKVEREVERVVSSELFESLQKLRK